MSYPQASLLIVLDYIFHLWVNYDRMGTNEIYSFEIGVRMVP